MSLDKQKHFATRIKYWFNDASFDDFLKSNQPSSDLQSVLDNNDYSLVNDFAAREPYFEKYQGLYGLEAALFRLNRLLIEYGVDLRSDFERIYSSERLHKLCNELLEDTEATITLSTFAANVICLSEILFPRGRNISRELAEKMLATPQSINHIYLYTHIILCDSNFYTRDIPADNLEVTQKMLAETERIISDSYDTVSLDMKLEFLVCCKLSDYNSSLREKIDQECNESLANSPFVKDLRKPDRLNTLNGAEHRNVLYIMSGLDH